jgi:hypothetical protein
MRVGILSDIHGNLWALKAALDDAKRRAVERFINLGDILYGPLKPRDTFELLQTIDAVTMQNYSPLASYAVVEKGEAGWRVELLKVPYDHALAAEQARRQGRDDWAKWIATGRAGA